jgi:putative transposase
VPRSRARRDANHVKVATLEWVDFFNTVRPHEFLEDLTPRSSKSFTTHPENTFTPAG